MMIECPRCGFEQPKDQFCAKCGLDIDSYVAKPKPALVRLIQNPNLHLSLIGILVALLVGYILFSERGLVRRQMNDLLDLPVSSRDAGDPNDPGRQRAAHHEIQHAQPVAPAQPPPTTETAAAVSVAGSENKAAEGDAAIVLTANNKVEVIHWEVPHEALSNLLALAEKQGETNAGKAYLYPIGSKIAEQIKSVGQRLGNGRSVATRENSQVTFSTPPTATEAFQYGLMVQVAKMQEKDLSLKWEAQFVLPQAETPSEAASTTPVARSVAEAQLTGGATMNSNGLVLLVMEPSNRSPRDEFLLRAGEGPWTIFSSPEFRSGLTDWVITVQIK